MPDLASNRRAMFDYEILERFDAGLVLTGHEAKSAKMGRFDIAGGHAIVRGNEFYLVGATIQSFQPKNAPPSHDPKRTRKFLMKRNELRYLIGKVQSGLTLMPLRAYTHRGFVKLELGLGRGRKKGDKREVIKRRETDREIQRASL